VFTFKGLLTSDAKTTRQPLRRKLGNLDIQSVWKIGGRLFFLGMILLAKYAGLRVVI
jgi:hypothetical protein